MYIVAAFKIDFNMGEGFGILRMLRLLRLSRLLRMVRLMAACQELMFIINGLLAALRSVSLTLGLMFCVHYIFAIILTSLTDGLEIGSLYFPTVVYSMYKVFLVSTLLDDVGNSLTTVGNESGISAVVLGAAIWINNFTMLNMLVGVLCDLMSSVANDEKERMMITFAKDKVREAMEILDLNSDYRISKKEFSELMQDEDAVFALNEVGVDFEALMESADFFFQSDTEGQKFERELPFDEFMDLVLQLRSANTATVHDIMGLRRYMHKQHTFSNLALEALEDRLILGQRERDAIMDYLEVLHENNQRAPDEHHLS